MIVATYNGASPVRRALRLGMAATLVSALAVSSAAAQGGDYFSQTGANGGYRLSQDLHVIGAQLSLAILRAQRTVEVLSDPNDPAGIEAGYWTAYDAYRLLRSAHEGLELRLNQSEFGNPMHADLAQQMWAARQSIFRTPGGPLDHLNKGKGKGPESVQLARQQFQAILARLLVLRSLLP